MLFYIFSIGIGRYAFALVALMLVTGVIGTNASDTSSQTKFKSGIAGRLTDPNGAVIAGATIRIIARSTKKVVSTKTDDRGEYTVDLHPDIYDVNAEAAGFKKARRKSIPVEREGRSFVDFMLEPRRENALFRTKRPQGLTDKQ